MYSWFIILKKMRVIVGIDECDESLYALQWTVDNLCNGLMNSAAGGERNLLTLVHVHQPSKHYGVGPSAFPAGPGVAGSLPSFLQSINVQSVCNS